VLFFTILTKYTLEMKLWVDSPEDIKIYPKFLTNLLAGIFDLVISAVVFSCSFFGLSFNWLFPVIALAPGVFGIFYLNLAFRSLPTLIIGKLGVRVYGRRHKDKYYNLLYCEISSVDATNNGRFAGISLFKKTPLYQTDGPETTRLMKYPSLFFQLIDSQSTHLRISKLFLSRPPEELAALINERIKSAARLHQ
jgi:hypothetical protein